MAREKKPTTYYFNQLKDLLQNKNRCSTAKQKDRKQLLKTGCCLNNQETNKREALCSLTATKDEQRGHITRTSAPEQRLIGTLKLKNHKQTRTSKLKNHENVKTETEQNNNF